MGISWNLADASRQLLPMLEGFLTGSGTETTYTGGRRSSLGLGPRLHTLEGSVPHWVWDRDYIHWREAFLTGSGTETTYTGGRRSSLGLGPRLHTLEGSLQCM